MPYKIYIDQGHNPGFPNAGAEGNGYKEQDIVYTVGIGLKKLLDGNPEYLAKVSRPEIDTVIGTTVAESLRFRVEEATLWGADIFLSLHANSSVLEEASGSEGLVYSSATPAYRLAEDILRNLERTTGLNNRGVILRPGLYVLRKTTMPSVLVELGFITNPGDAEKMVTSPGLFAEGIYLGILDYYA